MRIGILGAGHVGGALGAALTAVGHDVVFGVRGRDSTTTRDAIVAAPGARAAAPADAIADAEVIVVALRWAAVPDTIASLPPLDGRIVIDAMNRVDGDPARSTTRTWPTSCPAHGSPRRSTPSAWRTSPRRATGGAKAAMFVAGSSPTPRRWRCGSPSSSGSSRRTPVAWPTRSPSRSS